ncbi:MAG: recombinase family protein [Oligoflexales bacterium]|jgi:DNA invertase Pin-like site-specific DNA recombinase|nr:recombinase family protein [Oligoflexales bacterium]
MKNIAIYYRVSTEKQDLASQQGTIEKWLEDLPLDKRPKSVQIFQDEGFSGKNFNRPQFKNMMEVAYAKKIDTIVVYKLDRFSRNASDAIRTILGLDEVGVAFISVTQPVLNLGHENPFRRTMLSAFAEIAEIERETIVARVKSGLDAARKRGVKLGPPVRIDLEKEQEVECLRREGLSLRKIAEQADLSLGAVHKIIKSSEQTAKRNHPATADG